MDAVKLDAIKDTISIDPTVESQKTTKNQAEIDDPLDVQIYWYQILISVSLGLSMYYLLELGFPLKSTSSDPIAIILLTGYWLVIWIYLILLFGIPFIIFRIKTSDSIFNSLKRSVRTSGTQITLFLTLSALIFMLNI